MGEQLKPCPFCGARAEILGTDHLPYVCCENCGGSSDEFRTAERAAEDWNRRTPSPREAAIKEVAEALDSIAVYGSDTLSDPVKPTDQFYRDGVREMTNRARAALSTYRKAEGE